MALPKITHPILNIEVPHFKTKYKVRPMLIKEEKILLMAKESGEQADILTAISQVVDNCVVEPKDFSAIDATNAEVEYLFLKIRAISIGNKITLTYTDNEDEKDHKVDIALDKVEIKSLNGTKHDGFVAIDSEINLQLKYPPSKAYAELPTGEDAFDHILWHSLVAIYHGDKIHKKDNIDRKEWDEFVNDIPSTSYEEIGKFFESEPSMYYKTGYTNSAGTKREIVLSSLSDFFPF